jgi:hypothetical protein
MLSFHVHSSSEWPVRLNLRVNAEVIGGECKTHTTAIAGFYREDVQRCNRLRAAGRYRKFNRTGH